MLLYENAVAYQSELQEALTAAMNRLQEAIQNVHKIEGCLGKADFQLGRTRYILRKSGYGEILFKNRRSTIGVKFIPIHFLKLMIYSQFQGVTDLQSGSIDD